MHKIWKKENENDGSDYDHEKAALLLGKYVLFGININDPNEKLLRHEQYHGVITGVDERGMVVSLKGQKEGEIYILPAVPDAFKKARPGIYTLKETNEEVVDPDFTSIWTLTQAHPENRPPKNLN